MPPTEWHTITPLLFALLLRRRGLNVVYLGANVPAERFAETALKVKANLIILASQTLSSAAHLQHAALALAGQGVFIGFGGRIFNLRPGIADYIPGHFLGAALEDAVTEVESLLKNGLQEKPPKTAPQEHLSALHGFNAKRAQIESTLKSKLPPLSIAPDELDTSIHYLGDSIAAALQFGDMEHLSEEMKWLKKLLQAYQRPKEELVNFMELYSQAVDAHINGQGDPIKKWLNAYTFESN
ncbi:MAG: hypothetical protein HND47_08915 [Chloroflexi bacterium]|nr:hypothetical protein [Chloroflexota bacterium]